MRLRLTEFSALQHPVDVTIHSLVGSLYYVTARMEGQDAVVVEDNGKTLRSRKLQHIRELLQDLPVTSVTLRQESAYDEMVGQPIGPAERRLELKLPMKVSG